MELQEALQQGKAPGDLVISFRLLFGPGVRAIRPGC